jgi:hypothetical protein
MGTRVAVVRQGDVRLDPVHRWKRGRVMHIRPLFIAGLCAAIVFATVLRAADVNNYRVTILVSNEPGEAPVIDGKLVNAWGIATAGATPWWVSDNGSNWSTVYNGAGAKLSREVVVPGAPTGIVGYTGSQFLVVGHPALFMWATESGTILGWNNQLPDTTHAVVMHSEADAIYKGLAIHGNTLYTTDFAGCSVDTLDGTFTEFDSPGGFEDPSIPSDYCPFGIQAIGDAIFVTYALKGGEDDVAGQGHGFVREFDLNGNLIATVANHGQLNSPWGLAMAPSTFGRFWRMSSRRETLVMVRSTATASMATDSSIIRESCGRIENLSSSTACGASGLAIVPRPVLRMCCTSRRARMTKRTVTSERSNSCRRCGRPVTRANRISPHSGR